jgi:multiple sugar transport system ATP-binding protein
MARRWAQNPQPTHIAFVFQMCAHPHMNVRRNISYPLISQGMLGQMCGPKVTEVPDPRD